MATINYEESFAELQRIVAELEGGAVGIDILADKVKRANVLIGLCQKKLSATESEINKILQSEQKEQPKNLEAKNADPTNQKSVKDKVDKEKAAK